MTTNYKPGLAHLAYLSKNPVVALEELNENTEVVQYHEKAQGYSPAKLLVDINKIMAQAESKSDLKQGATVIQLTQDEVRSLSTVKGPMLNFPQLENELKRMVAINSLIGGDYTQIINKVTEVIINQVLNMATVNLDSAASNFYAIFNKFKITTLQKELTQTATVNMDGKNVDIEQTPEFLGGWTIVRLQSGAGTNSMQNYWINDSSKNMKATAAGVQPYGKSEVLSILSLCAKLTTFDWTFMERLTKNTLHQAVIEAKTKLEIAYEKIQGSNSAEQAAKLMDLYNKSDVLERMLEFPADVASMSRPAVQAALKICEQSIIRMNINNPNEGIGIAPELRTGAAAPATAK